MNRVIGLLVVLAIPLLTTAAENDYFAIHVVDAETNRGVPLVELKTVSGVSFWTDSAGWIAINDPEMLDQTTYFSITSHGYEYPKDGFGFQGKALEVKAGQAAELKLPRKNIAERLYRTTGAGIYRDSVLLGKSVPIEKPLVNALVQGSDSIQFAEYGGKLRWFWGDTNLPRYPLGLFEMAGATSPLPRESKLDIDDGINYTYFTGDNGASRSTAPIGGEGPTWVSGVAVVRDKNCKEQLLAGYSKIRGKLETYRRGLCRWNDDENSFQNLGDVPLAAPLFPIGHPVTHKDGEREFLYFCEPLPTLRIPATVEGFTDLTQYEAFTCLKTGGRLKGTQPRKEDIERDDQGKIVWAWKEDTPQLDPQVEAKWIKDGVIRPDEARLQLLTTEQERITPHRGNVAWNEYRGKWTLIAGQWNGKSSLIGEIWYAEADSLQGPWQHATKIVTHQKYDFYNPRQHSVFQKENGKIIYFEGTYTATFAGNPRPTPRYDYNQIMYKLDLSDPRMGLK